MDTSLPLLLLLLLIAVLFFVLFLKRRADRLTLRGPGPTLARSDDPIFQQWQEMGKERHENCRRLLGHPGPRLGTVRKLGFQ